MVLELLLHVLLVEVFALELLLEVLIDRGDVTRGGKECGFDEGCQAYVPGASELVVNQSFRPAAPEGIGGFVGEDHLGGGIGGEQGGGEEDAGRVGDGLVVGEGARIPVGAGERWVGGGGEVAVGEDAAPKDVVCALRGIFEHVVRWAIAEACEGFFEG